jgi:hypothetical protein
VTLDKRVESIDDIKDWLMENFSGPEMERWRCVLVKILGTYYRRELKGEELRSAWENSFVTNNMLISSEEELARYIK